MDAGILNFLISLLKHFVTSWACLQSIWNFHGTHLWKEVGKQLFLWRLLFTLPPVKCVSPRNTSPSRMVTISRRKKAREIREGDVNSFEFSQHVYMSRSYANKYFQPWTKTKEHHIWHIDENYKPIIELPRALIKTNSLPFSFFWGGGGSFIYLFIF